MISPSTKDIAAIFRDGAAIDRAVEWAGYDVVRRHRQLGAPLVVWQRGRVVEVSPESIRIPDDDENAPRASAGGKARPVKRSDRRARRHGRPARKRPTKKR